MDGEIPGGTTQWPGDCGVILKPTSTPCALPLRSGDRAVSRPRRVGW